MLTHFNPPSPRLWRDWSARTLLVGTMLITGLPALAMDPAFASSFGGLSAGQLSEEQPLGAQQLTRQEQEELNNQLRVAAREGNKLLVEQLIAKGADVNAQSTYRFTALMLAARENQTEICELLIAHGAAIETKSMDGLTALQFAAIKGQKEAAEKLIAKGAQVHAKNRAGETACILSASGGHEELCRSLIAHGADVYARVDKGSKQALTLAAESGHKEVCKLLMHAMVKLTQTQRSLVIALLESLKKTAGSQYLHKDTRQLIAQAKLNEYKHQNKPLVEIELNKIKNGNMKQELLGYLKSI